MIDSRITNNSIGVCLYESSGNLFYHNSFIDIDEPVISNFQSPVSPPSGSYMINEWDNGFEGNYWSDYLTKYPNATGVDSSGVWNAPYVIDTNNTDNNPLMVPYVIPEFPQFLILPLFSITTLVAVIVYKKKARPRQKSLICTAAEDKLGIVCNVGNLRSRFQFIKNRLGNGYRSIIDYVS